MSIATELIRIQNAKDTLKTKLNEKNDNEHQITSETIDNYGDFVDSISTGGISTVTSLSQMNTYCVQAINAYGEYLQGIFNNYPVYTENSVTLYTPDLKCNYYMIQKKSNNKYRILWSPYGIGRIFSSTYVGFSLLGFKSVQYIRSSLNMSELATKNIQDFKNKFFDLKLTDSTGLKNFSDYYYSNDFDTIEALINAVSSSNGNITYTRYSTGTAFSAVLDTPYAIPYTNTIVFDENEDISLSRVISKNETIALKS